jgi:hypothetical protein
MIKKVSLISEIPYQHLSWYFKPIKFRQLLILLTSEKSNFNPKKFKSHHFLSTIHIITLLSLSSHSLSLSLSLSLHTVSLSLFPFSLSLFARCLSLSLSSRSLCVLLPAPSGATVRIASLSLTQPHLRLLHCRTTFSNLTPSEYHCPTLIFGHPISSSGFTSWVFLLFFSLFFVCFIFWYYLILFYFLAMWVYFYLKPNIDSVKWHKLIFLSL